MSTMSTCGSSRKEYASDNSSTRKRTMTRNHSKTWSTNSRTQLTGSEMRCLLRSEWTCSWSNAVTLTHLYARSVKPSSKWYLKKWVSLYSLSGHKPFPTRLRQSKIKLKTNQLHQMNWSRMKRDLTRLRTQNTNVSWTNTTDLLDGCICSIKIQNTELQMIPLNQFNMPTSSLIKFTRPLKRVNKNSKMKDLRLRIIWSSKQGDSLPRLKSRELWLSDSKTRHNPKWLKTTFIRISKESMNLLSGCQKRNKESTINKQI